MADKVYKMLSDFMDEHAETIASAMYVLNGGKDNIDGDDVAQFLKDCLTEGLGVLASRAIQICEMEIERATKEKESAEDEDA